MWIWARESWIASVQHNNPMNERWIYLSYELSDQLSNYGDGDRLQVDWLRRIDRGDATNNSFLRLSAHSGTHIDYPFHFLADGDTGSAYKASQLIFDRVAVIDISHITPADYLIRPEHLDLTQVPADADFLLVITGFYKNRNEEKYWKYNWGWAPESAMHIRKQLPLVRALGFDLISLSAFQQREIGREAHRAFLGEAGLLIVEDLKLDAYAIMRRIHRLIVAPLRFADADGAPVTVLAEMNE